MFHSFTLGRSTLDWYSVIIGFIHVNIKLSVWGVGSKPVSYDKWVPNVNVLIIIEKDWLIPYGLKIVDSIRLEYTMKVKWPTIKISILNCEGGLYNSWNKRFSLSHRYQILERKVENMQMGFMHVLIMDYGD